MDTLAAAGAFATIVGLLCNFKAERSGNRLDEFLSWLEEKRHEDIAATVRNNQELTEQLSSILAIKHSELVEKLNRLDRLLSSIAGRVEDFSGLAKSIHRESMLSEQAISILKQLVNSGATMFMEMKNHRGDPDEYILVKRGAGQIEYHEPQFIEDDLQVLVTSGLLHLSYGEKGTRRFQVTRAASYLAKSSTSNRRVSG